MRKRGQAAMEFLMTYGWAILAAIIAIGVLAYFGIFNPNNLAGQSAVVNSPFFVDAFNVNATSVNLELTQNSGETVVASMINVSGTGPSSAVHCSNQTATFPSGQRVIVYATCNPALNPGDSFVGDVAITYTKGGSNLDQVSTGNMRGQVQ